MPIAKEDRLCFTPSLVRFARMRQRWSLGEAVNHFNEVFPEPTVKISKNQLLSYETGEAIPRCDRLAQLSDVYNVDITLFFTRSDEELKVAMGSMYNEVTDSLKRRGPTYLGRKN